MSNSKHTPGPWTVSELGRLIHVEHGDATICRVLHRWEREANARLIAAAPDLLAALRIALDVLDAHDDGFSRSAAPVARAALVKAEGRS